MSRKELSEIRWDTLEVASGRGEFVPNALIGLTSPDALVRERSYWQLDNEVVCQSDLYEAAYFVIPFVVAVLEDAASCGRDRVYDLLYEIASGDAPQSALVRTPTGGEAPLKIACLAEVMKARDVYERDAAGPDATIRAKAKSLLELLSRVDS